MSGSGSTIFALFDSEATLGVAQEEMQQAGWWCARVRPLGRSQYRAALSAARL
jgi:4-diphosphocytidyl-2C-methyl-D-erythritol kinase